MFCETGKIQFPNKVAAAKGAASLARQDKRHKYSHYKCPICGMFHTNTVKKIRPMLPKKDKYPLKVIDFIIPKKEKKKKKR